MPQLLLLAALGVGAYYGARWLRKQADSLQDERKKPEPRRQTRPRGKDVPTLKPDPETGVYKVDES